MASVQIKMIFTKDFEIIKIVKDTTIDKQCENTIEMYVDATGPGGATIVDKDGKHHVLPLTMIASARTEVTEVEKKKARKTTKKA